MYHIDILTKRSSAIRPGTIHVQRIRWGHSPPQIQSSPSLLSNWERSCVDLSQTVFCFNAGMSRFFTVATLAVVSVSTVLCTPLPFEAEAIAKRQSITALSAAQISSFKPFTFFASAAYCEPSTTINWSCGGNAYFLKFWHWNLIRSSSSP